MSRTLRCTKQKKRQRTVIHLKLKQKKNEKFWNNLIILLVSRKISLVPDNNF